MRLIGLDPGLRRTGFGIVEIHGNKLTHITHGIITPPTAGSLSIRLYALYEELCKVFKEFMPQEAAIEEIFVNTNAVTTLRLGMARGIALMTASQFGIQIFDYGANQVKKAVVGVGHANKDQVSMMVQRLLPGCGNVKADAADALAVAICHSHFRLINFLEKRHA